MGSLTIHAQKKNSAPQKKGPGAEEIRRRPTHTANDMALVNAAASNLPPLRPYTEGTYARRERVRKILRLLLPHVTRAGDIVGAMRKVYAASTVLTYAYTMAALYPTLRRDPTWEDAIKFMQKENAMKEQQQAAPATAEEVRDIIAQNDTHISDTVAVQWISASRHADLLHMRLTRTWPYSDNRLQAVRFEIPWFKSDLYGNRHCSKTIILPKEMLVRILNRGWASYNQVLRAIRSVHPHLTVHSIRRGAITALGESATPENIVKLTLHTMPAEPTALRLYMAPSLKGEEAKQQMELSFSLLRMIM